uniref:Pyridoxal phosphate homeostasis protein n=1 Tax=Macrostomum lignano TaxID=282301 RepID=A0A1I8GP38_9PLAT
QEMSVVTGGTEVASRLQSVLQRIASAAAAASGGSAKQLPRLVAVSKTKPISDIVAAYSAGQRHFGENYVQELYEKSHSPRSSRSARTFAGILSVIVNNLDTMETVDSEKLANLLHKEWTKTSAYESGSKLRVFIQVNTSNEEQKYGCQPNQVVGLAGHLLENCPAISLAGLMTIGSLEASHQAEDGNADFERLVLCRRELTAALKLGGEEQLELSMGMSSDFELAIKMGSTNVRVGSTIFGERNYSK